MTKIVFKDPPPKGKGARGRWEEVLAPLLKAVGRWALVSTERSAKIAEFTAGNLRARKVNIPRPDDDWSFASRGREVYGIYRGKKVRRGKSVRRTQRKG